MITLTTPHALHNTRTTAVAGTAHLRFARSGANTVLERSFATSPVKLFTTRSTGSSCWVYSATLGGGLVGGDAIQMTVDLGAGSRGLLATQASTKVYRSLRPASQIVSAAIASDALLAVVPDPVVCFAGADFTQRQRYELGERASLVAVDWMTSGRHATGERWAFKRYESRIDILRNGRRILYDGLVLETGLDRVGERMGRFDVCLTAVITGPDVADQAAAIVRAHSAMPVSRDAALIESASTLSDGGALLRIAGTSVEQVGRLLRDRLAFLHPLFGDDPWSRKW